MKLPENVKQALQDPTCGDVPLLHPHARLPLSWRKSYRLEIIFPQDLESVALYSLALSVSVEKSSSVDNLILILFCGILFPPLFGSLFFLQCVLKCHDSAT